MAKFLTHALVFTIALLAILSPDPARGAKKDQSYVVIAGTVFQENGFSLAGAVIALSVKNGSSPGSPKNPMKLKKLTAQSDARGEFAFRVPADAATYTLSASMKGFQTIEKEAIVPAQDPPPDRLDVTLVLPAESKQLHMESK